MEPSGILSALLTPFSADGEHINERELRRLVDSGVASGLSGMVTCGSTAEFAALTPDERRRVLEVVLEASEGRLCIVAQVGATSTKEALGYAKHADSSGADALILATPYYEPIQFDAVRRYFHEIASVTGLPLFIYMYPDAMRVTYDAAKVTRLMEEVKTVRYMKDSSGDLSALATLMDARTGVEVFVGEDVLAVDAFARGCRGAITGMSNFLAPALVQIYDAVREGNVPQATAVWDKVSPLADAVLTGHYNSGVKAVCTELGFSVGPVRAPYNEPFVRQGDEIARLVRQTDRSLLNQSPR